MNHELIKKNIDIQLPETKYCQLDEAGTQVTFYSGQRLNDNDEWVNPYTGEVGKISYYLQASASYLIFLNPAVCRYFDTALGNSSILQDITST